MKNREWMNPDPRHSQLSAEERMKTNKPYVENEKPSNEKPSDERKSEENTTSSREDE